MHTNTVPRMGRTTPIAVANPVPRMGQTSLARGFNPETHANRLLRPEGPHDGISSAPHISCDPSGRMTAWDAVSGLKPRARNVIPFGDLGLRVSLCYEVWKMLHVVTITAVPRMGHTSLARDFNAEAVIPSGDHGLCISLCDEMDEA
jgi:hypothetical protein